MAKQKQTKGTAQTATTAPTAGCFVGDYVADMREVLTASVLSGQHALLAGGAGWGKTGVARRFAEQVTGACEYDGTGIVNVLRIDDSTAGDEARGWHDPAKMLDLTRGERERFARMTTGTPNDPNCKIAVLDEIGRGNPALFNALMFVLDRIDIDPTTAPTCFLTTNFMLSDAKVAALLDRVGLWYWTREGELDSDAFVDAGFDAMAQGGKLLVAGKLPTWAEVEQVRSARAERNGKAREAVKEVIRNLVDAAAVEGVKLHPRRAMQWQALLYRTSVWHTGTAEFDAVPMQAQRALCYAHTMPTRGEFDRWQEIARSVVDQTGAVIEAIEGEAYKKLVEVSDLRDVAARNTKVLELADWLQGVHADLRARGGSDPRVDESINKTMLWYQQAAQGKLNLGKWARARVQAPKPAPSFAEHFKHIL